METKADLMRLRELEMFKVEVIDYHLRVSTDGNQTWCVLYVVETIRKVAFFKLTVRLWETNEQCLERLMLGTMLVSSVSSYCFVGVFCHGVLESFYWIIVGAKLRNWQWATYLPASPERQRCLDLLDPDVPGF